MAITFTLLIITEITIAVTIFYKTIFTLTFHIWGGPSLRYLQPSQHLPQYVHSPSYLFNSMFHINVHSSIPRGLSVPSLHLKGFQNSISNVSSVYTISFGSPGK